jgi:hypothetical protein
MENYEGRGRPEKEQLTHDLIILQQSFRNRPLSPQQGGVAQERLAAIGHGEKNPVASNSTPEGRAKNCRVEIALNPITK